MPTPRGAETDGRTGGARQRGDGGLETVQTVGLILGRGEIAEEGSVSYKYLTGVDLFLGNYVSATARSEDHV